MSASHAHSRVVSHKGRAGQSRRSPLKESPLRVAGQSLDEQITKLKADDIAYWSAIGGCMGGTVAAVWLLHFLQTPDLPWLMTPMAALVVAFCIYRVKVIKRRVRDLELGRDGERIIAEALESLREQGAVVFHDMQGAGFNIDHVIVSRRGIVAVETKTRSKFPNSKVLYDGQSIRVDGLAPDRDPVVQSMAEARALQATLSESTGKKFYVRPAVVFPGWWVESCNGAKDRPVWVLNEKALPKFVEHGPLVLSEEDFRLADVLERLNAGLRVRLGRDHQIGHSYFLSVARAPEAERLALLEFVWNQQVLPLLEEYFYGRRDQLFEVLPSFMEHDPSGASAEEALEAEADMQRLTGDDLIFALAKLAT